MAKPQQQKSTQSKSNDSLKPQRTTKTKRKPGDSLVRPEKPISFQIEDDVPDFPRGGGSSLSRREEDEVRAEVDAEFEQEQLRLNRKSQNQKRKKSFYEEDDLGSLFGEGITGKLPKFVNKITLKNVSPGMKFLGVIAEVNEKDLVISLPGGLRGLVRASEASDLIAANEIKDSDHNFLSSIFLVGQLVSCIVVQVDDDNTDRKGKRKIWLSLCLELLNKSLTFDAVQEGMVLTAYVKSIEDHGYILHFGLPSFSGFLPRKSKDGFEMKVNAGQLLQGVVRSIDKARRVVHMSSDPDIVSKCVTKDIKGISIDLLVPGMMVNARIQSTLENGIMLSFLTYFTGTVDIFHLENMFPSATWKEEYNQHKKVIARILFVDPLTRAVGLTMNSHLVHNNAPPSHVKTGEIYDRSRVVRVDRGMGLLLEIPSTPVSTPAYVSIFDVSDEEIQKLEKKFKEGNHVRVRVLGFRHLEGLAMGVLKASAFEGSVFTHSDVKPGMVVKGKIISVESFGAIVQFFSGVKALCPLPHMSEFDIAKPRKKFKVGAELVFRVLGCKSKRITVTHKKTLLKSKLKILSSYTDATDGLVTHGWITKIEKHGCFVRFYNGVQGFAPRSELGLEPGVEPNSMYHAGQVVKCRVLSAAPATRRINLSFIISPTRGSAEDTIKLGVLVSGVVERVTPNAVIVHVEASGYVKGTVQTEHLADHQGQATSIKSILKPGYKFDQLLVLDFDGNNLVLSAKYSLINSAKELPADATQFDPNSVIHGYICNIIESGCFVRFLGRVTAFSPKHKAIDDQQADISKVFYIGQSVRGHVLNVDSEMDRITLSLKQSSCFSKDASFLEAIFSSGGEGHL
ncbi:rRNA biogenesis protein RRP5 [Thalictrum thalictroides]|uniref:rRNA biogenesis protein RRP5 n=1 Tax=Thalictrum thalictroides TaxID=46969 RepID=A0A7J6VWG5_THATH|nr:rRNA biogenesis protein RRP5 [Thalictrum thalictroides]